MKRSALVFALVLLAAALGPSGALGSTNRDGTFGSGGRLLLTSGIFAYASPADVAVDRKGRIIVVGSYSLPHTVRPLVVRLDPDGTPDPTFGSNGVVELPWGSGGLLSRVAIDEADRIVVGGILYSATGHEEMVARLLENGEPDPGFSGGGLRTFGTGELEYLGDLTLDARGQILLAGVALFGSMRRQFTALRLTPGGALDPSFDGDGIVEVDFGGESAASAVAVDEQGRIVLGGSLLFTKGGSTVVARLSDSGALDPGFDGDGRASVPSSPANFLGEGVTAMALDPEGRPLLLGGTGVVRRLLEDGSLDSSFGDEGFAAVSVSQSAASDLAVASSGRILVASRGLVGTGQEAFLGRLRPRGTTDPWFASGGIARENYSAASADARAMTIDRAGRYLLVGSVEGSSGIGLARYLGDQGRCRGKPATLVGTPERDLLRGTGRRDVIVGLGGDDRILGFAAGDMICAGDGRDTVKAGRGNDTAFGGRGRDRLFGQAGADRLFGGPGRDAVSP